MPSVLISGASRGIGRATALRLAGAGWEVYAGVRREEDGEALRAAGSGLITPVPLDVAEEASIAALESKLPERLDAVVNNAGIVVAGPLEGLDPEELRRGFEVNVIGAVALTNLVLPRLRESAGRIVFVSSVAGRVSTPLLGPYAASKHAIEALADAWRLELRRWGIAVVLIEPGTIDTDIWREAETTQAESEAAMSAEHRALYDEHLAGMRAAIPRVRKLAGPVEGVAGAIEKALSARRPRARYMVGNDARAQAALRTVLPDRVADSIFARATGTPSAPG